MPGKSTLLMVILVAIIGLFLALSIYYGFLIVKIDKLPMDMKVGDKVGFYSDTDALHFGTVYAGSNSRRSVKISNNYDYPVIVFVKNDGNFSQWIKLTDNGFVIGPNSVTLLNYTVSPPIHAKMGEYSGMSIITIRRSI